MDFIEVILRRTKVLSRFNAVLIFKGRIVVKFENTIEVYIVDEDYGVDIWKIGGGA